ncbi:hypothetical protein ABR759_04625 [Escherichia coli]
MKNEVETREVAQTQHNISNAEITEAIQDLVEHALPLSEIEKPHAANLLSQHFFGLSFPVLKLAKSSRPEDIRSAAKDAKERNRYSTTKVAQRDEKNLCYLHPMDRQTSFCIFAVGKPSLARTQK